MPPIRLWRWFTLAILALAFTCVAVAQDPDNPPADPDAPPALEVGVETNSTPSFHEPVPAFPAGIDPESDIAKSAQFQRWWWAYSVRTNVGTAQLAASPTAPLLNAVTTMNQNVAIPPSGGISGTRWIALGAQPFFSTVNISGRVTSISVDPTNAAHWIIGAAQGGVWETLDTGTTWVAKTDNAASLAIGALSFAPSNPKIIYAGTGEGSFSGDSYAGRGLLKSTDGGTNWNLIATSTFDKASFTRLRVHPTNANILWASTVTGVAGLTLANNDGTPAPPRGVFKSIDGGVTWTVKLPATGATDLALKPGETTGQSMYAALGDRAGPAENGIYRSTDAGETFQLVTGPWTTNPVLKGRAAVAFAPSDPNTMYVSVEQAVVANIIGVWRTANAWDPVPTWTQLPSTTYCNGQCWYDQEIAVDPTDPLILYLGGINASRFNGSTTNNYTNITTNSLHADQHAFVFSGSRLIVGNDGGVWSSTNRGTNFTSHNGNIGISQYYHGSIAPHDETFQGTTSIPAGPGLMLAGAQDNGTQLYRGVPAWRNVGGGDGLDNALSPSNPTLHWATSSQSSAISRTLNGGQNTSAATSGIASSVPRTFMTRFEECPSNENLFITGTQLHLYKDTGFFNTTFSPWVANPVTLDGNPITFDSGIMSMTIAAADTTCNTYVFSSRSATTIPYTTDGGATWKDYRTGNPNLPSRTPTDFAFHPTNANVLYMTFSGFNSNTPALPGHVFKSTNAMSANPTFTDISPAVDIPFNTVAIDPVNTDVIYVGSDVGIWRSSNGGSTWLQMGDNNTGLPNVAVYEIEVSPTKVVAFTHGRGAYVLGDYDLNGDHVVNCADVKIVQGAMGSRIGQAAFTAHPEADLNNDFQVNVRDLAMITKQLPSGTVCP